MDRLTNEELTLIELRLQTLHQEHIAKQTENVALILTLFCRMFAVDIPKEAHVQLEALVKDFQTEGLQWREQLDLIRDGT